MRELADTMGSDEYQQWKVLHRLSPLGDDRGDLQAGTVAATIATVFGKRRYRPADFMPKWGPRKELAPEQLKERALLLMAAWGGRQLREGESLREAFGLPPLPA